MNFQVDKISFSSELARESIAVLASGGVESAALIGLLCQHFDSVHPLYLRFGLHWESSEEEHLARFLSSISNSRLKPLKVLEQPVNDIYADHWSITGKEIPDSSSPDQAVYLPGRNLFLLAKAAAWCSLNGIPTIALGSLKSNPFSDGSEVFMQLLQLVLESSFNQSIEIVRPFGNLDKAQVLDLSRNLPLELSFSCLNPVSDSGQSLHCGRCNKCAERQQAFVKAALLDKTIYAHTSTPPLLCTV